MGLQAAREQAVSSASCICGVQPSAKATARSGSAAAIPVCYVSVVSSPSKTHTHGAPTMGPRRRAHQHHATPRRPQPEQQSPRHCFSSICLFVLPVRAVHTLRYNPHGPIPPCIPMLYLRPTTFVSKWGKPRRRERTCAHTHTHTNLIQPRPPLARVCVLVTGTHGIPAHASPAHAWAAPAAHAPPSGHSPSPRSRI